MTNPAPICVLDEVDAPLDDANVERFCKLLHEMTERTGTRFLIVSHHPITMSNLDRLFGVTMGEQGVSQLVSVDLDQAEDMIAAE
jgi:chromosome segregation protein